MDDSKRHLIYQYLLTECLSLKPADKLALVKAWGFSDEEFETSLIRSVPSIVRTIIVIPEVAKMFDFDLIGAAGFFYDYTYPYCNWRINLPTEQGLLKPYFNERGRILGLYVYRTPADRSPALLSSKGLILGSPAIHPVPADDRRLAA